MSSLLREMSSVLVIPLGLLAVMAFGFAWAILGWKALIILVIIGLVLRVRHCSKCGKPAWTYTKEERDWSAAPDNVPPGGHIWYRNKYEDCPWCGYFGIRKTRQIVPLHWGEKAAISHPSQPVGPITRAEKVRIYAFPG